MVSVVQVQQKLSYIEQYELEREKEPKLEEEEELMRLREILCESVSSYSVGTGHSVPNQATSSKNVRSGSVHNEGVTSWYIDIGDCDRSYKPCGARFWYRERIKGYSKDRKPTPQSFTPGCYAHEKNTCRTIRFKQIQFTTVSTT
ncbi:hypothetical protein Tco_1560799 [Tanacetum coccineum]